MGPFTFRWLVATKPVNALPVGNPFKRCKNFEQPEAVVAALAAGKELVATVVVLLAAGVQALRGSGREAEDAERDEDRLLSTLLAPGPRA